MRQDKGRLVSELIEVNRKLDNIKYRLDRAKDTDQEAADVHWAAVLLEKVTLSLKRQLKKRYEPKWPRQ